MSATVCYPADQLANNRTVVTGREPKEGPLLLISGYQRSCASNILKSAVGVLGCGHAAEQKYRIWVRSGHKTWGILRMDSLPSVVVRAAREEGR
ncbi:hypothetical protein BH23ACT11_BH23ACT11_30600 [soil metagenome]